MAQRVVRTHGLPTTLLVVSAVGVAMALASHFREVPVEQRDGWAVAVLVAQVGFSLWIASWARARVVADEAGVQVINPVRRYRVAWSDIAGFGWGSFRRVSAVEPGTAAWSDAVDTRWTRWAGLGLIPKTCLLLRDGAVVPMFGLAAGGGGVGRTTRRGIRALERGLAAYRGEPLPPWPLPRRLTASGWVSRVLVAGGLVALLAADYRWVDQMGAAAVTGVVLVAAGAWRWARVRVRVDSTGLRLVGWASSERLVWEDVHAFEVAPCQRPLARRVMVVCRTGRRVPVRPLTSWLGARRGLARQAEELQEILADQSQQLTHAAATN